MSVPDELTDQHKAHLNSLDSRALASTFAECAFVSAAAEALAEQAWLIETRIGTSTSVAKDRFSALVDHARRRELSLIVDSASLFKSSTSPNDLKLASRRYDLFAKEAALTARLQNNPQFYQRFCLQSMKDIATLVTHIQSIDETFMTNAIDRAFDRLDNVLGLSFDDEASDDPEAFGAVAATFQTERVFAGAGIGVQSSYTSLIESYMTIRPKTDERIIDLGSGYGRAGFVLGLLHPSARFIGYEYVEHRVEMAHAAVLRLGIGSRVEFKTQDLGASDFKIPVAEIYYLYDPFNDATYRHVSKQLLSLGSRHPIRIATRGRAGDHFQDILSRAGWLTVRGKDDGKLSLFYSPQSVPC